MILELKIAVDACAEAEHASFRNRKDYYAHVMSKYWALHEGDCQRGEVSVLAKDLVERRLWERYGQEQGIPEADFMIPEAWWRRVASGLGFTDHRYVRYDVDGEEDATGGDTSIADDISAPREAPRNYSRENAEPIRATQNLIDALSSCLGRLKANRIADHMDPEVAETYAVEANAIAGGLRELVGDRQFVPTAVQPMFTLLLATCPTMDSLFRRLMAGIKSEAMEARRAVVNGRRQPIITQKEVSNIVNGRLVNVHPWLELRSSAAAQLRGYHGARCPRCGGRRCVPDGASLSTPRLKCLHCYNRHGGETFVAPQHVACPQCLRAIHDDMEGPECPHCGVDIGVPHALRKAAKCAS